MRPQLNIRLTLLDLAVEFAGWLGLIALLLLPYIVYSSLPETIPIHFDGAGHPDNYTGSSGIYLLPIIGATAFIALTIINYFPHMFHYPVRITNENALTHYTFATRLIRYTKLAVVVVFFVIVHRIYQIAIGVHEGLGFAFYPLLVILVTLPLAFYLFKIFVRTQ